MGRRLEDALDSATTFPVIRQVTISPRYSREKNLARDAPPGIRRARASAAHMPNEDVFAPQMCDELKLVHQAYSAGRDGTRPRHTDCVPFMCALNCCHRDLREINGRGCAARSITAPQPPDCLLPPPVAATASYLKRGFPLAVLSHNRGGLSTCMCMHACMSICMCVCRARALALGRAAWICR